LKQHFFDANPFKPSTLDSSSSTSMITWCDAAAILKLSYGGGRPFCVDGIRVLLFWLSAFISDFCSSTLSLPPLLLYLAL
jgi:hypothetical protein